MTILIKNGRVLNPSENMDKVMDIYVRDGMIQERAENIQKNADKVAMDNDFILLLNAQIRAHNELLGARTAYY